MKIVGERYPLQQFDIGDQYVSDNGTLYEVVGMSLSKDYITIKNPRRKELRMSVGNSSRIYRGREPLPKDVSAGKGVEIPLRG